MASRRARIKVAPNLASIRSKTRPPTAEDKCKDHVPKPATVNNNKKLPDNKIVPNKANSVEPKPAAPAPAISPTNVTNGIHSTNRKSSRVENNNEARIAEEPVKAVELPVFADVAPVERNDVSKFKPNPSIANNVLSNTVAEITDRSSGVTSSIQQGVTSNESETKSSWQEPNLGVTGKFVDGRYIPAAVEKSSDKPSESVTQVIKPSQSKATVPTRRFPGMKTKFKPNLAPRARPDEVLPRRSRKFSNGDTAEQRKRNNSTGNLSEEGDAGVATENQALPARIRRISSTENIDQLSRSRKLSTGDRGDTVGRRRLRSESNSSDDEGRRFVRVNGVNVLVQPRSRRLSSNSSMSSLLPCEKINPALKRRKIESKRRFSNGVPGRGRMTMFDLIYYNPENGTEMTVEEEPECPKKMEESREQAVDDVPGTPKADPVAEEEDEMPDEDDSMPVPQVKVGINGEIILDDTSIMVETTAAKKAKTDLTNSPVVVENASKFTNYGTWSKKKRYSDWTEKETFKFYRALSIVGSDFSMMESLFKKRTRAELKLKFKKEERMNNGLVDKCLRQKGQFTDITDFMDEESEEEEEASTTPVKETRGRKRKSKGATSRRRFNHRSLYESSSGGEEADVSETSRSPARKRPNTTAAGRGSADRRPTAAAKRKAAADLAATRRETPPPAGSAVVSATTEAAVHGIVSSVQAGNGTEGSPLAKLPGVRFPPGLLAANPGLAGAKPGSLVVVASPSKVDPSAQLLHVYMVSEKKKKGSTGSPARSGSVDPPRSVDSNRRNANSGRLSIDPAVVRAVDRKRSSASTSCSFDRSINSRMVKDKSPDELSTQPCDSNIYRRQRTLSEGNMISPTRLRTLSGSQRTSNWLEAESEGPYLRTRVAASRLGSPIPPLTTRITATTTTLQTRTTTATTTVEAGSVSDPEISSNSSRQNNSLPIARKSKPVLT